MASKYTGESIPLQTPLLTLNWWRVDFSFNFGSPK